MNRIDRLFNILTLLQSKKYVPAEKIAQQFSLSVRTVYRDVKALSEAGIPVSFEPQRGYFIVQGYFLPPVAFSKEEANAFLLMESIVKGFADKSIQTHFSSGLQKIRAVMRGSEKESVEVMANHIRVQTPDCFNFNYEYLTKLQNAIAAKQAIELDYKNNAHEVSSRQVEPIGLIFYALHWHLIGWCSLRKDYRDFKVARILRVTNTSKAFTKTDHMPLQDYMKKLPVAY
ncbi:MAG TPA: YafY family protein [Chitinophagaceae bacterium]|nr:YafY family protein [Chitinophagaceae bacterium]